ncbi:putative membrane protein YeiH [Cryobacterium mesophilum]|uniref:Trimeric intracellular cation channel family protein n=1 Tax=Terrimesophilobacter mesophilus TaxID=433647 RepID=A0A4R8VAT4_9MICO|nr:TRIC cation channel family protein [Terrimesophilobacter mesophilus]MBB5632298.1 putative membrane protein YeiH [Terrimesophilobacter mesophilus]TFB79142.1 trimeric intracellular cation channel family protein [Terrimesophilobacter mesophilus]
MDAAVVTLNDAIRFVDLAGVLANAILGGIAARAARLDLVGFVILAILSGLGGGMIRDTLLQQGAPVALTDPYYLGVAILGAIIAFFIPFKGRASHLVLLLLDVLAVGCWAAVGAQKGLAAGLGWLPAVLLGMVTAVGGGMVRDVLLMKVPTVFGGNTLYATSAFVASIETVILTELGYPEVGSVVAILSAAALSLLARRFGWILPSEVNIRLPKPRSGWRARWWSGHRRSAAIPAPDEAPKDS